MDFSHETQEKISRFAKEQSMRYLDEAEMTYLEKLRGKAGQTKRKVGKKLSRFNSGQARDAENDMLLYMSDYMEDMISRGMTEREAFEKAREELSTPDEAGPHADLNEHIRRYCENRDPTEYEAVGVLYGGFTTIGLVIGAIIGYIISGGRPEFLAGGWIDTLVGAGAGAIIGAGLGQIGHAVIIGKKRR